MDSRFKDIMNGVDPKPGRSRLEPYGELVEALHSQGFTCRDIATLLAEKCQFQTSKTAVNNFVRAQARKRRNAVRKLSRQTPNPTPVGPKLESERPTQGPSEDEVRRRIAALKAHKPLAEAPADGFHYDPDEPLRLINPGKRDALG